MAIKITDECINCGGSEFEWGWLHPNSDENPVLFSVRSRQPGMGRVVIRRTTVRQCLACNHLDLFALNK